jgi:hypothetical protein
MARAAISPELDLYRTPGKWSLVYAAFIKPPTIYTARVNQVFASYDGVTVIEYDNGSGTLANVRDDMEVWIGSTAGAHDIGIGRLIDIDANSLEISEASDIAVSNNDYITIVAAFSIWARPPRMTTDGDIYMDERLYNDQHTNWHPSPCMGADRVLELTGASVSSVFSAAGSFVPGSAISSYLWECDTASSSSGTTTASATFTFNSVGTHVVYLTLDAANGKSFFGVRYVYVWNESNLPSLAEITNPGSCDVDAGGWSVGITLWSGADLSDIYVHAKVIIFTKDYYGGTQTDIGPVSGSENVKFIGWISGEINVISSEAGSVSFTAHGGAFWMGQIPSWPDGVEFVGGTATAWTNIQNLTVDLGVYHFLRWRTTVTRVCDVTLTGDTRLTQEVRSSAQNLWAQLQEMTWSQIYARPGFNALNQLSIQIHPNLIPSGSRTYPTVMDLTTADYLDGLEFERSIIDEVGIVDMSGIIVSAPNVGKAKFALAPGHSLPHYGDWDIQPNLLLSSQEQLITLAGLYRSWRNNRFNNIPMPLVAPVGLIDCFPNQKCTTTIPSSANLRGWGFSGGLIPLSVSLIHDPATGYLHTEVNFEAETSESIAVEGDVPGSGNTDNPPEPPDFPDLPFPPIIIPGPEPPSDDGPSKVIFWDVNAGFIYTENFHESQPDYFTINAGLTTNPYPGGSTLPYKLVHRFFVTPNGAFYAYRMQSGTPGSDTDIYFLARAPYVGGTFEMLVTPYTSPTVNGIFCAAFNPLVPETVMYLRQDATTTPGNTRAYIGAYNSFAAGANGIPHTGGGSGTGGGLSYGFSKWLYQQGSLYRQISLDGMSASGASMSELALPVFDLEQEPILRAGTTATIVTMGDGSGSPAADLIRSTDNLSNKINIAVPSLSSFVGMDMDPTGNLLMGRWGGKGKSSDGGATWAALPNLTVSGGWWFKWAGGSGVESRWIAAASTIQYSDDFGDTWTSKMSSSLTAITAVPDIRGICVVEY